MLKEISQQDSLKQWYLNYIDGFRKEYEKLSSAERKELTTIDNILEPCQIEIFWLTNPDYQLAVFSKFSDRPDKEIIINGPYRTREFLFNVVAVLKEDRWARSLRYNPRIGEGRLDTIGDIVALGIHRFVDKFKEEIFETHSFAPYEKFTESVSNIWFFIFVGNIAELDHNQEITKIIQNIKRKAKDLQEKKPISPSSTQLENSISKGFGVHLFPPVVIGTEYKRDIEEIVRNSSSSSMGKVVIDLMIDNHKIVVFKDGFIFLEGNKKEYALKFFNLVMACGTFYDFVLYAAHKHELVEASYNKRGLYISSMAWDAHTMRTYLVENINSWEHLQLAHTIKPETMKNILSTAEKILKHGKLADDVILLNEGRTHFFNFEFASSFVMSWTVVERHYSDLWNNLLDEINMTRSRKSKLSNSSHLIFSRIIKTLSQQNKIDKQSYKTLLRLKKKRNGFHHEGRPIAKDDASQCLSLATQILNDKMKPYVFNNEQIHDDTIRNFSFHHGLYHGDRIHD